MHFRFSWQSIPASLAAVGSWAIIGGWYLAIAPANLAGADNIGIVLSTLGICLFLADRLTLYWLKAECWVFVFKLWLWGLLFIAWGLAKWLNALSRKHLPIFIAHWLAIAAAIAIAALLARRQRQAARP